MRTPTTCRVILAIALVGVLGACSGAPGPGGSTSASSDPVRPEGATSPTSGPAKPGSTATRGPEDATGSSELVGATPASVPPSDTTTMRQVDHLTGGLSPKSVVANRRGAVIANNMMYNHSITVYNARSRERVATIDDSVDLAQLGHPNRPGKVRGAPVEGAFTADGRYAYVSNYSMYGKGFGPEGLDTCRPGDGTDRSYLYRVDLARAAVDQAVEVGSVPKYVAVTPDQKRVLVSNWCSWDLSVVDVATRKQVGSVPIAAYPRGIAVSPDSRYAFVTAMGTNHLYRVDLRTMKAEVFSSPGSRVRHVAASPDGAFLYTVSSGRNNGDGSTNVAKIDARTGKVLATVVPGREPRSLAVSHDGRAVYVVNYDEGSVSKVRTDTMSVMQTVRTDAHPIGVTYEPTTGTVWVCAYDGAIHVLDDTGRGATPGDAATGTPERPQPSGSGSAGGDGGGTGPTG